MRKRKTELSIEGRKNEKKIRRKANWLLREEQGGGIDDKKNNNKGANRLC